PVLQERFLKSDSVKGLRIKTAILAPIIIRDETVGTLVLYDRKHVRYFTEEDKRLVESFVLHLALIVETLLEKERDAKEKAERTGSAKRRGADALLGTSPGMKRLRDEIRSVARSDAPVSISGETGSGKELVAQAIHEESDQARGPYVCVNVTELPESLLEAELFGHTSGAFSGAKEARKCLIRAAHGGTLFLDE